MIQSKLLFGGKKRIYLGIQDLERAGCEVKHIIPLSYSHGKEMELNECAILYEMTYAEDLNIYEYLKFLNWKDIRKDDDSENSLFFHPFEYIQDNGRGICKFTLTFDNQFMGYGMAITIKSKYYPPGKDPVEERLLFDGFIFGKRDIDFLMDAFQIKNL